MYMSCEQTQEAFSLYLDDRLALPARKACDEHLLQCPTCRAELSEMRSLARELGSLSRPVSPPDLASSISDALVLERAARLRHPPLPPAARMARWLQPRMMPYSVGTFASLILFMGMFSALRLSLTTLHDWDAASRQADAVSYRIMYVESGKDPVLDLYKPISPASYAAGREPYAGVSPSLNPRGALAALTRSSSHDHAGADDMVVVADVFSNGIASLAGVVQAPRDRRMLDDFQSALRQDAAFVPASFDRRPETVRVVFVVQKVDVREGKF
jgi:hypothetical protein